MNLSVALQRPGSSDSLQSADSHGRITTPFNTSNDDMAGMEDDSPSSGASDDLPLMVRPKRHSLSFNPNAGVTLSWQDLSVYVPIKKTGLFQRQQRHKPFKRILNNVTGIAYPGSLMAVMGASGAGKTSLMNVLAYRAQGSVAIDGEIRVNGTPVGKFMSRISGYVYQEDLFTKSLTVLEHLTFMTRMKLDRRLSKWERQRRVEELLVELNLKKCENTRIEGLSGGEKKRLAFASEVLTDPALLFCDEPTTGLDSFSAQKIVGMMRKLAAKGKTIICTIHQPSSQVFAMFDHLCLLAEGRTAYFGGAMGALDFLRSLNYICPEHFNPADFYIRTLAVYPGKESESRQTIKSICDTFAACLIAKDIEEKVRIENKNNDTFLSSTSSHSSMDSVINDDLIFSRLDESSRKSLRLVDFLAEFKNYVLPRLQVVVDQRFPGSNTKRPFWFTQLSWLTWRNLIESSRNPRIHIVRTVQKILLALLIGFCFFGVKMDQKGIQDVQGALFVFITENTFPSMYGVLHVFPSELPLFLRETKNDLYPVDAYYLSRMIALLPGFIIEPMIFATIAYWMVGLRATFDAYMLTCVVILLTANTAAACGCFFSAAFDDVSIAVTCLIPFDYILMVTGGLFINIGTLGAYIAWTKYISWFMYANEAMSVVQWVGVTNITCDADPNIPCIPTGDQVLESRSFKPTDWSIDFIGLTTLYCVFHLGAYISLLYKSQRK